MPRKKLLLTTANLFGVLGYISTITQWLWSSVVIGYPLLSSDSLAFMLPAAPSTPAPLSIDFGVFSPIVTGIVGVVTVLIVCLTIFMLIRLPYDVGKRSSDITHKTASALVPIFHPRPISKKQKRRLTYRFTGWLKTAAVLLPLIILCFAPSNIGLERHITIIVGVFCSGCSAMYFALQRLVQSIGRLKVDSIW